MDTQQETGTPPVPKEQWYGPLNKVTLVSKLLAAVIFIALPFVGFILGRVYAPETVPTETVYAVPQHHAQEAVEPTTLQISSEGAQEEGVATTTVTAYVKSIDTDKVVLDYIDIYGGQEACRMLVVDGKYASSTDCFAGEPGPLFYDRNINNKLRTSTLAPNLKIISVFDEPLTVEKLNQEASAYPQEVTIDSSGRVTQIRGIFRP